MDNKEIEALINLLDDPDDSIYKEISKRIIDQGMKVIPALEKAWEGTISEVIQERLENIIQTIQFRSTYTDLSNWMISGEEDLLYGTYLVARYQFPELIYDDIYTKLEPLVKDSWLEMNDNLTALEKVRVLNHIIFDIHGFSGNNVNFYSPQNSYINQVLETKKGNPISLSILYSFVAQKLDIPIYGVNLPKNFILAYKDLLAKSEEENILFYINPFNKGAVLGKREIQYFIKQHRLEEQESFYTPCSNSDTIQRLLLNLIHSYEKLGYKDKLSELQKLHKIFQSRDIDLT